VGDAVFGVCEAGQVGTYAEKIAAKAAIVARKPSGLSHINAAALALTGLTAMSAIEDAGARRRLTTTPEISRRLSPIATPSRHVAVT
jgi:NADPH:quinone reductase-like Zn-dependent oxidoreductase